MEKTWRARFPNTKTAATEIAFEAAWDLEKADWIQAATTESHVKFSGRIDRIDTDGNGHYAMIDYKSSVNNLRYLRRVTRKRFDGWFASRNC